jgi:branched-subunit amino acid transport protein
MIDQPWLVASLLIVATALTRSVLVLLGHRVRLPTRLQDALLYAPACALAAIVVPPLLVTGDGRLVGLAGSAPLWAAIAALLITLWTKSMLMAIAGGMLVFWALRAAGVPV